MASVQRTGTLASVFSETVFDEGCSSFPKSALPNSASPRPCLSARPADAVLAHAAFSTPVLLNLCRHREMISTAPKSRRTSDA
jgi:hypothetical protein